MLQLKTVIEDHIITLKDGRRLGYSVFGDVKGKPLFYFHGWPTSRLQAELHDESAKKLHIKLIAVDRPGYGLSDFQNNRTLLDWPDDVVALADHLKIKKFSVMGVSGGGPYAAVCAYKIPKRLKNVGIVVGLAPVYIPGLLDGISFWAKLGWANYAKFPILRTLSSMLLYLYSKYIPSIVSNKYIFGAKADKKVFSDPAFRKLSRESNREAFKNGYKGAELDLKLYTTDWKFDLKKITSRVYLFYGADDKNVSIRMGKYYASQIQNSTLKIYPNEGHLISKTHDEEILTALIG